MGAQLQFDFDGAEKPVQRVPSDPRRLRGRHAYLSGVSAEDRVARECTRRGWRHLESRWRGVGGEIDLIFQDEDVFVFCEVKKARSFDEAVSRLRPAQIRRICAAAEEYLGNCPNGLLSEVRFDLAVMNETGQVDIIENAFGHF